MRQRAFHARSAGRSRPRKRLGRATVVRRLGALLIASSLGMLWMVGWPAPLAAFQPNSQTSNTPDDQPTEPEEDPPLPKLEDMQLPSMADLLRKPPLDWVVLKTDEVIVCRPVYPRPNTLAKLQALLDEALQQRASTPEELEELKERRERLRKLTIILPGEGEEPEYQLETKFIKEIIHHEDLMLRRVDELLKQGRLRDAYEMLFVLERRHPGWPGAEERHKMMLFREAETRLEGGDIEQALAFAEELHDRDAQFSGLSELLGRTVDRLIGDAVQEDDDRRARHFLARLERRETRHPIVLKWRQKLSEKADGLVAKAVEEEQQGHWEAAADLVRRAVSVWPYSRSASRAYARIAARYQTLDVGVLYLPGRVGGYPQETSADFRRRRLSELPLFAVDRIEDVPHYTSRLFEQWEPIDLGREIRLELRSSRSYWESQPVVTAGHVADMLRRRLDPNRPEFDERLADYVRSLSVRSPFELVVKFDRIPLRAQALFTVPLEAPASENPAEGQPAGTLAYQRFRISTDEADRVIYTRTVPEPDGLKEYHVARIIERVYESPERAIQGLLRGDVSMITDVRPADAQRLSADDRLAVRSLAVPVVHLLQFHPRSRKLAHRELRRALAYALDRNRLLDEVILQDAPADWGSVLSGPFPSTSYAYNALVDPRPYDPLMAFGLARAAAVITKQKRPQLRMLCPPDPLVRAAAKRMIEQWAQIGIDVTLIEGEFTNVAADTADATHNGAEANPEDASQPPAWDILYRTVRMTEPLIELWPLLTMEPKARIEGLVHLPDWLRQEIIELDRVADWKTAIERLHQIHADLQAEVRLIPLWEVQDFVVVRKTISGLPKHPLMHPYDGVERWIVQPWFPVETP